MNILKQKADKETPTQKKDVILEAKIHKYTMVKDIRLKKGSFRYKSTLRFIAYMLVAIFVLFLPTFLEDSLKDIGNIIIIKLLVAVFCSFIIEGISRYFSEKKSEDKLENIFYREEISNEIRKKNEELLHNIEGYLKLLGFEPNDYDDIENFLKELNSNNNIDEKFKNLVRKEILELFEAYSKIKSETGHYDNYKTQFVFAEFFCKMSNYRFWATSTDRIGNFQKQNYGYYEKMYELSRIPSMNGLIDIDEIKIPKIGRIFIGDLNSFAADIINDYKYLFELYKMHLFWNKNNDNLYYPIRFFLNDKKQYEEYFRKWNVENKIIKDFMIVDHSLVYGREEDHVSSNINLKLITNEASITKYEKVYIDIWNNSISLSDLAKKVFEQGYWESDKKKKKIFLNVVENIESKLEGFEDYSSVFPTGDELEGEKFFMTLCEYIGEAQNTIIAIDRANKKTNNFWEAWLQNEEYKSFYNSCIKAASKGTKVRRLYVIENKLSDTQKNEARNFIEETIKYGLEIRFIDGRFLDELELVYLSDFIIVGITDNVLTNLEEKSDKIKWQINNEKKHWLGFELLGDQYFIKSALSLSDNLIAKRVIIERGKKFNKLWNNENTIKLKSNSKEAIDEFINEIFNIKGIE